MQSEIHIRPMVASDYETVIALWRSCDGVEVAWGDDEASFRAYMARNPGLSQCAEAAGRVVGAALCGHDGRRGLIYHLAVRREHRGRGIGRAIVQAGLAGLRLQGICRTILLVDADNTDGREFWLSQGFEPIEGVVLLGKNLT